MNFTNITIPYNTITSQRTPISCASANGAQTSNAQFVFGNASALFNGVNSAVVATNTSNLLSLASGNFTIEFRYYPISKAQSFPAIVFAPYTGTFTTNAYNIMDRHNAVPTKFTFWVSNYSTATPLLTSTTTVSNGQWYAIAVVRSSNNFYMFINGTLEATATYSGNLDNNPAQVSYGTSGFGTNAYINGYLDEIRMSNTARYTSNYTVATQPFTNDSNTRLLLHCDGANGGTSFPDDNIAYNSTGFTITY